MSRHEFAMLRADRPAERARWLATWNAWPEREVFAHPSYVELFTEGQAVAGAAVAWLGGITALYPFILRPLDNEPFCEPELSGATDIVSPYGYGGPYWWGLGDRDRAAEEFWRRFNAWAAEAQVVSEFVRFDLMPERLVPYPGTIEVRLQNVIRSLDLEPEALWMDMAHKVRKNVQRAQRSGLVVVEDERGDRLEDFLRIYGNTMSRREAAPRYFFPRTWFERLLAELSGQFTFFHVLRGDDVVSSELVLVSAAYVYSFLGGTDESAFADRPNDLLKYEVIRWASTAGKRAFVLGGGFRLDDGIFRYKASFAPRGVVPFSVGMRVLDAGRYEALCRRAAAVRGSRPFDPQHFPQYRG